LVLFFRHLIQSHIVQNYNSFYIYYTLTEGIFLINFNYFLYNSLVTSSAEPIVGVSGYLVGNSLLSVLGSEQLINNKGNININFLTIPITLMILQLI